MTFTQKMEMLASQVQRHAWNAQNFLIKKDSRWILCAVHVLPTRLFVFPGRCFFSVQRDLGQIQRFLFLKVIRKFVFLVNVCKLLQL